jgi:transmembrane sensor
MAARLNRQILEEASAWFVDFRVGDTDVAARAQFDRWLRQSPEHIRAYMAIARTYVELPALKSGASIDVEALVAAARSGTNIIHIDRASPTDLYAPDRGAQPGRSGEPSAPRRRTWLLAASVAFLCMAAALAVWLWPQHDSIYATDAGESRRITLSDRSTVELNAHSRIAVRFSKSERRVELLEGQVLFEVAKDRSRPFIVRTGNTLVRAVGTQFDVDRTDKATRVTVVEGRVAVMQVGPPLYMPSPMGDVANVPTPERQSNVAPGTRYVSAGEQVTVTAHAISEPTHADIATETAWTQHQLLLDDSRLSDVVSVFNRYNVQKIVIDDRRLDDFRVSGVYSSTDPSSLVRFLREQPGILVTEADDTVHVVARQ